jgi:hypothetical protein
LKKEKRRKIFAAVYIILGLFVISNFIAYIAIPRYTFIDWEYVYTPELANSFIIPVAGGLGAILFVAIINAIVYYRNASKFPEDGLMPSIRHSISIRRQKRIKKTGKLSAENKGQIVYNRFGTYERALHVTSQLFPIIIENEEIEVCLGSLIYDEEILDEKCGICKLTFNQGQTAIFCPNCETLFHKDHLTNWLESANHCPVCKYKFLK